MYDWTLYRTHGMWFGRVRFMWVEDDGTKWYHLIHGAAYTSATEAECQMFNAMWRHMELYMQYD